MSYYHDTTVLGGLLVTIGFTVQPAEPDVGIFSEYVDDWWIEAIAGRPVRRKEKTDWIDRRMTAKDREALVEELAEAGSDW